MTTALQRARERIAKLREHWVALAYGYEEKCQLEFYRDAIVEVQHCSQFLNIIDEEIANEEVIPIMGTTNIMAVYPSRAKGDWISCTDKLPEYHQVVLLFHPNEIGVGFLCEEEIDADDDSFDAEVCEVWEFSGLDDTYEATKWKCLDLSSVTHWMPIEPPKGE